MSAILSARAVREIRSLISQIVRGDFAALVADGRIGRLTPAELRTAVDDYGRTLVELPDAAFIEADVYPVEGVPGRSQVDLPLWSAEEGRSDLTIFLTVNENETMTTVSIDDLRVP